MSRKSIELYNFGKYQPYLESPLVDRIEGNADEMVLSADGYEQSASNGLPGSLTINANGGVWTDTGPVVTCDVSSSFTTTANDSTPSVFLTFNKNVYRGGTVQVTIETVDQSAPLFVMRTLDVIHDSSTAACSELAETTTKIENLLAISIDCDIVGDDVQFKITGVPANTKVKCVCKYNTI